MKNLRRRLSQIFSLDSINENELTKENNEEATELTKHVVRRRPRKQEAIKRLSLPTDIKLPEEFLAKISRQSAQQQLNENLTRKTRRASLSEIGFGKLESYQKLDKLGEGTYA